MSYHVRFLCNVLYDQTMCHIMLHDTAISQCTSKQCVISCYIPLQYLKRSNNVLYHVIFLCNGSVYDQTMWHIMTRQCLKSWRMKKTHMAFARIRQNNVSSFCQLDLIVRVFVCLFVCLLLLLFLLLLFSVCVLFVRSPRPPPPPPPR